MSCFDPALHQKHGDALLLQTSSGTCCLACLLTSLQEASILCTFKSYSLSQFLELLSDPQDVVQQACCNHAAFVVPALVGAVAKNPDDAGIQTQLSEVTVLLASAAPFMGDMLTQALVQAYQQQGGPGAAGQGPSGMQLSHMMLPNSKAALLAVLASLLEAAPQAATVCAQQLQAAPSLIAEFMASLQSGTMQAVPAVSAIVRVLAAVLSDPAAAQLMASTGHHCLHITVQLLSTITANHAQVGAASAEDIKVSCLRLIHALVTTGCLQETACASTFGGGVLSTQSIQSNEQLASGLLTGLKPCLLASSAGQQLQLLAAQLLATLCSCASPQLLQYLIQHDVIEYLCECLRASHTTLEQQLQHGSSVLGKRRAPAGMLGTNGRAPAADLLAVDAEQLQGLLVTALRYLACEGDIFVQHVALGMDSLLLVGQQAAISSNICLLADIMALLVVAAGQSGAVAAVRMSQADMRRCVKLATQVFPIPSDNNNNTNPVLVTLSPEAAACCTAACRVAQAAVYTWARAGGSSRTQGQRGQQHQQLLLDMVSRALQGITMLHAPCLPELLSLLGSLLHAWLMAMPPTVEQHLLSLLLLVDQLFLPSILRCKAGCDNTSEAMEAAATCMSAVAELLLLAVQDTNSSAASTARQLAGHMLQTGRWTSICMEVMSSTAHYSQQQPAACWYLVLAMQQGAGLLHVDCAELAQLQALPSHAAQRVASQLAHFPSWQAVLQHIVDHGTQDLGAHTVAPLLVLLTSVAAGDEVATSQEARGDMGREYATDASVLPSSTTWLQGMLVDAMFTCHMQAQSSMMDGSLGIAARRASQGQGTALEHKHVSAAATAPDVQAAAILSVVRVGLQVHFKLQAGMPAEARAHMAVCGRLEQLLSVVRWFVTCEPEALELGSDLGNWVLNQAAAAPSLALTALATWLEQAAHASPDLRVQALQLLATHAQADSQVLQLLVQLVASQQQQRQQQQDGAAATATSMAGQTALGVLLIVLHSSPQALPRLAQLGIVDSMQQQLLQATSHCARLLASQDSTTCGGQHLNATMPLHSLLQLLLIMAATAAQQLSSATHEAPAQQGDAHMCSSEQGMEEAMARDGFARVLTAGMQLAVMVGDRLLPGARVSTKPLQQQQQQQQQQRGVLSVPYKQQQQQQWGMEMAEGKEELAGMLQKWCNSEQGCQILACLMDINKLRLICQVGNSLPCDVQDDLGSCPPHVLNTAHYLLATNLHSLVGVKTQRTCEMGAAEVDGLPQPLIAAGLAAARQQLLSSCLELVVMLQLSDACGIGRRAELQTGPYGHTVVNSHMLQLSQLRQCDGTHQCIQHSAACDAISPHLTPHIGLNAVRVNVQQLVALAMACAPAVRPLLIQSAWLSAIHALTLQQQRQQVQQVQQQQEQQVHQVQKQKKSKTRKQQMQAEEAVPKAQSHNCDGMQESIDSLPVLPMLPLLNMLLQNAAVDIDAAVRVAGAMGLSVVQAISDMHGDGDTMDAGPLRNSCWGPCLLHECIGRLCDSHQAYTTHQQLRAQEVSTDQHSAAGSAEALLLAAMLSDLLLLLSFFPSLQQAATRDHTCHSGSQHLVHAEHRALHGQAASVQQLSTAGVEAWVMTELHDSLKNPDMALLELVLKPPSGLQPFTFMLTAQLVRAGVLDAGMLMRVQGALSLAGHAAVGESQSLTEACRNPDYFTGQCNSTSTAAQLQLSQYETWSQPDKADARMHSTHEWLGSGMHGSQKHSRWDETVRQQEQVMSNHASLLTSLHRVLHSAALGSVHASITAQLKVQQMHQAQAPATVSSTLWALLPQCMLLSGWAEQQGAVAELQLHAVKPWLLSSGFTASCDSVQQLVQQALRQLA